MGKGSPALSVFLSFLLVVGLWPGTALADDQDSIVAAQADLFSSAEQAGSETADPQAADTQEVARKGTGALPNHGPVQSVHDENADDLAPQAALPASYSSVAKGKVTSVQDQGELGTCWAFAAIASAESSVLSQGMANSVDLSERHLSYFTYHNAADPLGGTAGDASKALASPFTSALKGTSDPYLGTGGNSESAMYILASWMGAADESTASYSELKAAYEAVVQDWTMTPEQRKAAIEKFLTDTALDPSLAYKDAYHLRNGYMIALQDRQDVKQAIMNHGAVAVSYDSNTDERFYNEKTHASYNYETTAIDHNVAIVGWDDGFSASDFGLQTHWTPACQSAPEVTLDADRQITVDDQGIGWVRFTAAASGYYTAQCNREGSGASGALEAFRLSPSGQKVYALAGIKYGTTKRFYLEAGATAYLRVVKAGGGGTAATISVKSDTGMAFSGLPEAKAVQEGKGLPVEDNGSTIWCTFVPQKTGYYTIGFQDETSAWTQRVLVPDDSGSKLIDMGCDYMPSTTCALTAGQRYYIMPFRYGSTEGNTNTFIVNFEGPLDEVGGSPFGKNEDYSATQPPQNGAWLCKNSWGTDFGDNGYFWLSYEDAALKLPEASVYAYEMGPADDYDHNYQYDGTGASYYNHLPSGGTLANVFTAKGNPGGTEALRAVAFTLYDTNVDYSIQVYLNPTDKANPASGSPVFTTPATGRITYGGYHTVQLPRAVTLPQGMSYAVAITLSHKNGDPVQYAVETTDRLSNVQYTNAFQKGQSLSLSPGASRWYDLSGAGQYDGDEAGATARIKAFTDDTAAQPATVPLAGAQMAAIANQTYTGKELRPKPKITLGGKTLREDVDYKLSYKDNVKVGTATVTATGLGAYSGTKTGRFRIVAAPASKIDISKAVVTVTPTSYAFDGKEKRPAVTVRYGGKTLRAGTDYQVRYANNIGRRDAKTTATATAIGVGAYTGGVTGRFTINAAPASKPSANTAAKVPMYRMFNPVTGEHFYTASAAERDYLKVDPKGKWNYEGVHWSVPKTSSLPVYRLCNPVTGDHHFTMDRAEYLQVKNVLKWRDEGIGWYSEEPSRGQRLYRLNNPRLASGAHHYPVNPAERDQCKKQGWIDEGYAWYVCK